MLSSFSSKTMTNNDAVNTAEARLKELLDKIQTQSKTNPILEKVSKELTNKVNASIAEIKKAKAEEQKELIGKVTDTANALIKGLDDVINGDPITSATGIIGMIGTVSTFVGGPVGVVVGAVCSVVETILSLFGGGATESAEDRQRKMFQKLLDEFQERNVRIELKATVDKIQEHFRLLTNTVKDSPDDLESIKGFIDDINRFFSTLQFTSTLSAQIEEYAETSDPDEATRAVKFLFFYTMVYSRLQLLIMYVFSVAQEYELESTINTFRQREDAIRDKAPEVLKFINGPENVKNREIYKQFFLQDKKSRDAIIGLQQELLKPEQVIHGDFFLLQNTKNVKRILLGLDGGEVQASSIVDKYWSTPAQRLQAEPARQMWQIFPQTGGSKVALYNIYTCGYLCFDNQVLSLDTAENFYYKDKNTFILSKENQKAEEFRITHASSGRELIVNNDNSRTSVVSFATPGDRAPNNIWIKREFTRAFVVIKNLQRNAYIAPDLGKSGYYDVWSDEDQATVFEQFIHENDQGEKFASFKAQNAEVWLNYVTLSKRIKPYQYPSVGTSPGFLVSWKLSDQEGDTLLQLNAFDNPGYYIGLYEDNSELLYVNSSNLADQKKCHFKIENVGTWQ